jgi:hypothetical protein
MPRHDDEDGNTIIDDGLSDYYDQDRPVLTSAQAAALLQSKTRRRHLHILLLCLSLFISLVVSTAKYYASVTTTTLWDVDGRGGGDWILDKDNQGRLIRTLEYLKDANISSDADWIPSEKTTSAILTDLIFEDYSPQYAAALWIAAVDARRVDIPPLLSASRSSTSLEDYLFLQRYVLAILYFATGGLDQWVYTLRFMSASHECYW